MVGINKVILVGNLGRDPEVVIFDQIKKTTFSLATTEVHKNKDGERVEETEWHNIVCWRGLAEIAEKFLKKGMQIYVEGKLKYRMREDKDGNKRQLTEIVADNFTILSKLYIPSVSANEKNNQSTTGLYTDLIEGNIENADVRKSNISKLLSEDMEIEKLGDLPF
ncbi:MAG TPA: single-stranded DNA-binding protein [Candidatus Onthomorpha intestinigallinarum]|uniref:Single-stranded DNA-binding protein n=1 Tax=Candidatus Onthomorpha intestinigallinarum TaxID=2840880 RepID=A0A9D1RHK0_9BACT|nr:single-stranded DNA-binding protein [Candidatus Onthomorpha intestinigallinarum]